jgi:hypothetical protein
VRARGCAPGPPGLDTFVNVHVARDSNEEGRPLQLDGIHRITCITADPPRNVDFHGRVHPLMPLVNPRAGSPA